MVAADRLTALALVVGAVCLTVTGETFLKSGMNRVGTVEMGALSAAASRAARVPQLWIGFGFIGAGAILWLAALSRAPLSWAYPILSLGYVLVLFSARFILHEPVSWQRWAGTLVIVGGLWLVFRS
ncbi:MAG: EamA family transporter [Candidatus Eisenbacteria bacterium]|nr:EamA family transporter [Candidatus Eisenbacteria bacterium]